MIKNNNILKTATFAGGCFWCTEAIFKRIKGVASVTSGYTGGDSENPSYQDVSSGETGHAEGIQITFDPKIISYNKLLDVFWATHDPTTLNQQGADAGTQYRSAIFYHDGEQKKLAETSKKTLEDEQTYDKQIVTEIVPFTQFYPAEDYHKNYYDSNRQYPYCCLVIDPKIQKLMKNFEANVKEEYKS